MLNIGVRVPRSRVSSGSATRSAAVRADPAVFAAVYERHQQELYRYCRSIVQHDEDARDALQNTMAKAYAALQTEDRDFELRPWLFRIAHNEAISLIRRRPATDELDERTGGCPETLQRSVEAREQLSHLYGDLQDLPERQRGALMMRELNGLSTAEIADALEIPVGAVKQTIYEARTGLHECAAGRDMVCDDVQRTLSEADGRLIRSRRMRAHLRSCRSCQQFRHALTARPAALQALFPVMPLAAGTSLLAALKGGTAAGTTTAAATSTAAGTSFMGFGGGLIGLGATKIAVVAATTVAAVGGGGAAVVTLGQPTPTPSHQTTETHRATPAQRAAATAATSSTTTSPATAAPVATRRVRDARARSTSRTPGAAASSSAPSRADAARSITAPGAPAGEGPAGGAAQVPAADAPGRGAAAQGPATGAATAQDATARRPDTTAAGGPRPTVSGSGPSTSRTPAQPARPTTTAPSTGAAPAAGAGAPAAGASSAPATSPQRPDSPGGRTVPGPAPAAPATAGEDIVGSVVRPGGGRP